MLFEGSQLDLDKEEKIVSAQTPAVHAKKNWLYRIKREGDSVHLTFLLFKLIAWVALHPPAIFLLLYLVAPALWQAHTHASWTAWLVIAVLVHGVGGGMFEWVLHRAVLHRRFPGLEFFFEKHGGVDGHHAKTPIQLKKHPDPEKAKEGWLVVVSNYPITADNLEHATFPSYALAAFMLVFAIPLVPLQLCFPKLPILGAGACGLSLSLLLYEAKHRLEHMPEQWWRQRFEHPLLGWLFREIHSHHATHHLIVGSNLGISGVFGIPLYDYLFGTYRKVTTKWELDGKAFYRPVILMDGELVHRDDFLRVSRQKSGLILTLVNEGGKRMRAKKIGSTA